MKSTLTLLVFLISSHFCIGQTDTLFAYVDLNEKLVDESQGVYQRIAIRKGNVLEVEDHYLWDRALRMKGNFTDDSFRTKQGLFSYYYEDGRIEQKGSFADGKKEGLWMSYDEHGEHQDSSFFIKGRFLFSYYWDEGRRLTQLLFDSTGKGEEWRYFKGGLKASYGKYAEGYIKDSIWTYYYRSGGVSCKEYYTRYPGIKKDSLVKIECFDESGNLQGSDCGTETMPRCHRDINQYLSRNIRFPMAVRQNAKLPFARRVIATFVVDEQGKVTSIRIIKHGGVLLDTEATRVIREMPRWDPGISHNRPVRVNFTFPIVFKLE